jgi:hypothetical protein
MAVRRRRAGEIVQTCPDGVFSRRQVLRRPVPATTPARASAGDVATIDWFGRYLA